MTPILALNLSSLLIAFALTCIECYTTCGFIELLIQSFLIHYSIPSQAPRSSRGSADAEGRRAAEKRLRVFPFSQRKSKIGSMKRIIQARIYKGERYYVGEALDIPVVTQGGTLDEVTENLRDAIGLHLEGEDLAELGFAPDPAILATIELEAVVANAKT
jgi:predicted RNase H-like HicB family nuclease